MSDKPQPIFVHYTLFGSVLVHLASCGRFRIIVNDIGLCNFWRLCEFLGCNQFSGPFFHTAPDSDSYSRKPHKDYKVLHDFLLSPLPYGALERYVTR